MAGLQECVCHEEACGQRAALASGRHVWAAHTQQGGGQQHSCTSTQPPRGGSVVQPGRLLRRLPACCLHCASLLQAVWLFESITAARHKYFLDPRREARGWRVTPVIAAEQQVRPPCWYPGSWLAAIRTLVELLSCELLAATFFLQLVSTATAVRQCQAETPSRTLCLVHCCMKLVHCCVPCAAEQPGDAGCDALNGLQTRVEVWAPYSSSRSSQRCARHACAVCLASCRAPWLLLSG